MLQYFSNTVGVSKFVALIDPDNHASRGVARNTGFIESGLDTSGPRPMHRHENPRGIQCRGYGLPDDRCAWVQRPPSQTVRRSGVAAYAGPMGAREDALLRFRDACQRHQSIVADFVGGSTR